MQTKTEELYARVYSFRKELSQFRRESDKRTDFGATMPNLEPLLAKAEALILDLRARLSMAGLLADMTEFHETFQVPIAREEFDALPLNRVLFRQRNIHEEYGELTEAFLSQDIVEVADAFVDLIYFIVGGALEFGIPLDRVWEEVHRSNMAKVQPDGTVKRRASDGKVEKPEGWQPPDIEKVMFGPGTT